MNKTNALRQLDIAKISYRTQEYQVDESDLSGLHLASQLGIDPQIIFKTLVTIDDKGNHFVFCLPVDAELDLKKCALAAKTKRIELIPMKDLLPLTGYLRGGCSPIGMKKAFPTYIHETAFLYDEIYLSAGLRGLQMIINPNQLAEFIKAEFVDIIK